MRAVWHVQRRKRGSGERAETDWLTNQARKPIRRVWTCQISSTRSCRLFRGWNSWHETIIDMGRCMDILVICNSRNSNLSVQIQVLRMWGWDLTMLGGQWKSSITAPTVYAVHYLHIVQYYVNITTHFTDGSPSVHRARPFARYAGTTDFLWSLF